MRKYLTLILLCFLALNGAKAQDNTIKVVDFYLNENDLAANMHGSIVYDQNGEKCALIKIRTNQIGFSFDVGMLGVTKTVQKTGEIWVYVPEGVKHITLYHTNLASLKYDFKQPLQRAKTYILELQAKEIFNVVDDKTKVGTINLEIYPPTANIVINAIPVKLDQEGKEQVQLYYGRYTYELSDPNYYPVSGLLKIDRSTPQNLKIRMKQAFGWLNLSSEEGLDGATIYIDNNVVEGTVNTNRIPVKHGSHTVRIENPLYLPYSADFSISDSTTTTLAVTMQQNYGTVTLNCADPQATIFVDGQLKAKGAWTGKISTGNHTFECRRGYHNSSTRTLNIGNGSIITVPLDAPTPILGTLDISTNPEGASVYLNDTLVGTTPFVNRNILIGEKTLRIEKQFYTTEEREITLSPDSTVKISVPLTNRVPVNISASIDSSKIYLNGEYKGVTPYADTLDGGKYSIKVDAGKKYKAINKTIDITPYNNEFHYTLKRDYTKANEMYLEVNYMLPTNDLAKSIPVLGFNIGKYIHNVCIEAGIEAEFIDREFYLNNKDLSYQNVYIENLECFHGSLGYGISLNNRLRFTPQVGIQYVWPQASMQDITPSDSGNNSSGFYDVSMFGFNANASCRLSFAVLPFMGISITPSYKIPIKESSLFEIAKNTLTLVKNANSGFSAKAGIVFFF